MGYVDVGCLEAKCMSGSKNSQSQGESWLLSAASDTKLIWGKHICFLTDGKSQKTLIGIISHCAGGEGVAACCWHVGERAAELGDLRRP